MKRLLIITIAIIVIITYLVIRLIIEAAASLNPCKGKKLIEQGSCVAKCSEIRPYIDGRTCVPNCPINKPYIDGEYCVDKCPIDKPFLKNGLECVNSCLPGIVQFNECVSGECTTKYTDITTGECSDVITEGKYALGNKLVSKCPDEFYNELRECNSIGNKKWSSVAVSKDGIYIYAAYKDDTTGKYNMYIIKNKSWKVIPDIKNQDYIEDIKISNNIVIYRSSNNSNLFNTYKISEDNGNTFNDLIIANNSSFKDIDLDYNGIYIIVIGSDTQYGSNILVYDTLNKNVIYTIDSDSLVAQYQNLINNFENNEGVPANYVDSKTKGLSISWVQSKPHLHSAIIKLRTYGYNRAVKCRIGQLSNNNEYKILIATQNMLMTTKLDLTDVQFLTFGPKDSYQFVYDKMGFMYDFAITYAANVDDFIGRFGTRDAYANSIKQLYEDRGLAIGLAWGNITDIQISNDMKKVYVEHIFNSDLYFRMFSSCSNAGLGKGRRDNGYCCLCNREWQEYSDYYDEGDIYVGMMEDYDNALVNANSSSRPDLLKKYVSVLTPFDTTGKLKNASTENYTFTETYELMSLSTTYNGNNVAVFNTTNSPLINLNLSGTELEIKPFRSFTTQQEGGWDKRNAYKFNDIYASKHKILNKDGKYIIASIEDGPLYYSENFGVSWIKI